ncbi:MMPL family transporter [Rhodobacteraceae bacterium NNCM2]|nr:MMPL family transporter [Coraliihabitans acroporae]
MFSAIVAWVERHPKTVLAIFGVLLIGAILAASTLRVDTDSSKMLSPELPFQEKALALREAFPDQKETILVVVRAANPDLADETVAKFAKLLEGRPGIADIFAPATDPFLLTNGMLYLSTEELDRQLGQISSSANLIAGLRSDQTLGGFLGVLNQARILAEGAGEEEDLAAIYDEAAEVFAAATAGREHPFGWTGAFTGDDGETLRIINVLPELDYSTLNPAKPALNSVREVIVEVGISDDVQIGVTGDPALRQDELRSVSARIGLSLGMSLLFVAVVLWLALRTFGRVLVGLGALFTTLILTAGFAALAVGSLNLISIAFVVLMVGLGIDFAIHFLAHLDERANEGGDVLARTGASIGPALALTAASTALAFFAFTVTDFIGMAQLGLIGGAGVIIAFIVSLTFIPALVALRPSLAFGRARGRVPVGLADGRVFAGVMAAIGVAAIFFAVNTRFDADPMTLRDPDSGSVRAFDWLAESASRSPLRVSVLADSADEAVAKAEELASIDGVENAAWLGSLIPKAQDQKLELIDLSWPSLEHAVSGEPEELTETDPATPASLSADLAAAPVGASLAKALSDYEAARKPETDRKVEEMLFRYFPHLIDRLSATLDIDLVTEENLPAAMTRQYLSPEGVYRVEARPVADIRDPAARASFVDHIEAKVPDVTGAPAQIEGARRAVAAAMLQAVAIALVGASLLTWVSLSSITGTLAVMVPVILAGMVCMAAGVLLDMPFNYANVIVLPLMIGIGVDSGIHLAIRAREENAVFSTSTPMATFYSALTTIAAFGTLGLSDHRGTASMGILLAIGLSATVLMTFALTPMLTRLGLARK